MPTDLALSNLTIHHGEPRVADLDLAAKLGMADPHDIRRLINRNSAELGGYGELSGMVPEKPSQGRPGRTYLLNEPQALLVCMFARTERAAEVRRQVIEVFRAYRQGLLPPPAAAASIEDRLARLEAALSGQSRGYASDLADELERRLADDGEIVLGPTDAALCVAALRVRSGQSRRARLTAADVLDAVRSFIVEAGREGVGRTALAKRFEGLRMDREAALTKLIASGEVMIVRRQNPGGGPRATIYRFWTRYPNNP